MQEGAAGYTYDDDYDYDYSPYSRDEYKFTGFGGVRHTGDILFKTF